MLSKNIHKVTKTDYVWFDFLWIRRKIKKVSTTTKFNINMTIQPVSRKFTVEGEDWAFPRNGICGKGMLSSRRYVSKSEKCVIFIMP